MSGPTLDETVAVLAAAEVYGREMHPSEPQMVNGLPHLLDEMAASIARLQSVTHIPAATGSTEPAEAGVT